MLLIGLTVVVAATAYAQIELNAWNRPFYDALSHKNVPVFLAQLGVFAELPLVLLILNVGQAWLDRKMQAGLARRPCGKSFKRMARSAARSPRVVRRRDRRKPGPANS